ncbi:hypothetical protein JHK86_018859 [Glycine max]|nr:hypothetical protein JHK86_018859 [Glycine max]
MPSFRDLEQKWLPKVGALLELQWWRKKKRMATRIRSIPLPALYRCGSVGNLFLYYDFVLCAGMGGPRGFAFDYNHHPVAATDERLRLFLFLCYRSDEGEGNVSRIFHPNSHK